MELGDRRRLVVNADDFGASPAINRAVEQAHREGILTTASLMVTGAAAGEAVAMARAMPRLGVGLHLVLTCGRAASDVRDVGGLVDGEGKFRFGPVSAGWRYYFQRQLEIELLREMHAQFRAFHRTGLVLDHVNGHLNLHMHPVVFRILMRHSAEWGVRAVRVTADPLWLDWRISSGHWLYRLGHGLIFYWLARHCRRLARMQKLAMTHRVFGLLRNGRVDERYMGQLLRRLGPGASEIYAHPCTGRFRHELDSLTSPAVRAQVDEGEIELVRYQDLNRKEPCTSSYSYC